MTEPPAGPTAPVPAAAPPPVRTVACPRCGRPVAPAQDWCLECGAAARTRLVRAPNWKLPVAAVVTVLTAAVVALAFAFVALTDDGSSPSGTTGATGATAVAPAAAPAPAPAPAPAATGASGPTG